MYWKFICKNGTEAECFGRQLFGDLSKLLDLVRNVKNVKRGDTLFLHNVDTDVLFGPFTAETNGEQNIERDAWSGHFPSQVKVSWKAFSAITDASQRYRFQRPRSVEELTDQQGEELSQSLVMKLEIPSELKQKIQQLDGEIHSLAHRMEEVTEFGKGHPADRIIELDRFRSEFVAKMRDFVWAVRRLDKDTGILDLPSNR